MRSQTCVAVVLFSIVAWMVADAAAATTQLNDYVPGSFLQPFTATSSSRDSYFSFSLFNASGDNFTVSLGVNMSASTFIVYPNERHVIMSVDVPPMSTRFYVLEYAPNTAPWISKTYPWCTSNLSAPFYLGGFMFATDSDNNLYRISFPTVSGGACSGIATGVSTPMSLAFDATSNSIGHTTSVTWISSRYIMQLSVSIDAVPFVTLFEEHNLLPPQSEGFISIDVDVVTGNFYASIANTDANLTSVVYRGDNKGGSAGVKWTALSGGWTPSAQSTQSHLIVDSRYYGDVMGPLLCTSLFFGPSCFATSNGTAAVWTGAMQHSFGSGFGLNAVYDSFCH